MKTASGMPDASRKSALTRRECFGYGLVVLGWPAMTATGMTDTIAMTTSAPFPQAQSASALPEVTRSMLIITGTQMSKDRLRNATGLFGVILDISKELRAIDLGEIEPATTYTPR